MTMSMIQFAAGRKNIGGSGRFLEQRYWDLQLFAYPTLDLHLLGDWKQITEGLMKARTHGLDGLDWLRGFCSTIRG